jgi:hypothetical protein
MNQSDSAYSINNENKKGDMLFVHNSSAYTFFQLSFIWLIFLLWVYGYYWYHNFTLDKEINFLQTEINQSQNFIAQRSQWEWYNRFIALKSELSSMQSMTWSEHIQKLIEMLMEVQSIDFWQNDSVEFFDFSINLEKLSLKWNVSNVRLLYVDRPSSPSIISRFLWLHFLKNISLKEYTIDWWKTTFTLDADVVIQPIQQ